MIGLVRKVAAYHYDVPWCVPAWGAAELRATLGAVASGHVVHGRAPARFAEAVRTRLGVPFALPVNRGRTAIEVALRALGVSAGDEVVLPSYVCDSVLEAVERVGATPVFADVGPDLNVTPETVRAALTARTRCVIVAHLFGTAAAIEEIERELRVRRVALIDDAAQSVGARRAGRVVGTFGDAGIASCGPGKALAGAAGAVLLTRDEALLQRAASVVLPDEPAALVTRRVAEFWLWRRLRRWSLPVRVVLSRLFGDERPEPPHVSARLANVDAAIALAQVARLDETARHRRANARALADRLGAAARWIVGDRSEDGMALKTILVLPEHGPSAEAVIRALALDGVESQPGYTPCHHRRPDARAAVPYTESVWRRVVCVPVDLPPPGALPHLARLVAEHAGVPAAASARALPAPARAFA